MSENAHSSIDSGRRRMVPHLAFLITALCYSLIVFENLRDFPPYFFCDEAIHLVEAQALLDSGKDMHGVSFPLYPLGLGQHQLSLSVYLQIPFNFLLGYSEYAVRARSAFFSILGIFVAYLLARELGAKRYAWLLPFFFLLTPVWFLHSRTAFESFQATVFLLWAIYFYVKGLHKGGVYFALSAVMAAGAFYSYIPARGWIFTSGVVFLLAHCRSLWAMRRSCLAAFLVFVILMLPFLYVSYQNPDIAFSRLKAVGGSDLQQQPLHTIVGQFFENYARALSPSFWFDPDIYLSSGPEERHTIPTMPYLPQWMLPLVIVGVLTTLYRIRDTRFSTLLIVLCSIPITAAPFAITNLRVFPLVGLQVLYAFLGFHALLNLFLKSAFAQRAAAGLFAAIFGVLVYEFHDFVMTKARYAYRDYAFYGIQYGTRDVFEWVEKNYQNYPRINIASNLFNAGEIFLPTYLSSTARQHAAIANPIDRCHGDSDFDESAVWIIHSGLPAELIDQNCPINVQRIAEILDPLGRPLFLIGNLKRESLSSKAKEERQDINPTLTESTVTIGTLGPVRVRHSALDTGTAQSLFDGDTESVARTAAVNPFELQILALPTLPTRIGVIISNNHVVEVAVKLFAAGVEVKDLTPFTIRTAGDTGEGEVVLGDVPTGVDAIHMRFHASDADEFGYVHVREVVMKND